jgi:hypothetical protein
MSFVDFAKHNLDYDVENGSMAGDDLNTHQFRFSDEGFH